MLIGLAGRRGSGKTELAEHLVNKLGYLRTSFAEPVRAGLMALDPYVGPSLRLSSLVDRVGWQRAKLRPEVRRLMQRYGTEAGRDIHGRDCWVNHMIKRLNATECPLIVIDDVRFENEAQMVSDRDGIVIKVQPNPESSKDCHDSELVQFEYDYAIGWCGTVEARFTQLEEIMERLRCQYTS